MLVVFFRVWVELKPEDAAPEPDQIGYINVIPELAEDCGTVSKPNFESFDVTLKRINERLAHHPLPGIVSDLFFGKYCCDEPTLHKFTCTSI